MEELIKLQILSLNPSSFGSSSYILLMKAAGGEKELVFPMVIGSTEAQVISIFQENMETPRPMTHQLFHSFIEKSGYEVKNALIRDFRYGVFYAHLNLSDEQREIVLDARPSDAIALCVKTQRDIFIDRALLESICLPDQEIEVEETPEEEALLEEHENLEVLRQALDKAIMEENYEAAAAIRDQIEHLKNIQ